MSVISKINTCWTIFSKSLLTRDFYCIWTSPTVLIVIFFNSFLNLFLKETPLCCVFNVPTSLDMYSTCFLSCFVKRVVLHLFVLNVLINKVLLPPLHVDLQHAASVKCWFNNSSCFTAEAPLPPSHSRQTDRQTTCLPAPPYIIHPPPLREDARRPVTWTQTGHTWFRPDQHKPSAAQTLKCLTWGATKQAERKSEIRLNRGRS